MLDFALALVIGEAEDLGLVHTYVPAALNGAVARQEWLGDTCAGVGHLA